jgi:hypothetical protein
MLTIRREQMEVFARAPRVQFENRLMRHCAACFPDECKATGDYRLRKLVQDAIELSTEQGFGKEREIAYFLSLIFSLGVEFYCDAQLPWNFGDIAGNRLADRVGPMDKFFARAMQYLDETAGPDNENLVRAMVRARNFDPTDAPPIGDGFETGVCAILKKIFPEKFAVQGETATRALIRTAIPQAAQYGIKDSPGVVCYAGLMFMLGCGMHKDPIYGWAVKILNDPEFAAGSVRGRRLFQAAAEHISESLGK